ncbi:MAG TPA: spore coat U domain-containing protein [Allosphingosinicella sp.]
MTEGRTIAAWTRAAAFALVLLAALVLAPGRTEAGVSSCSVTSSGIVFSPYDGQTKAQVDGTGTISVTCTGDGASNGLSLNITSISGTSCPATRQMASGTNTLGYNIYRETGRTNLWCDGGSRFDINMDFTTGATQTQSFPMYGRVFASQNPIYTTVPYSGSVSISVKRGGATLASTTATITGSVAAICSVSAGTLGFGAYSGAVVNATGAISVNCSNGAAYQVAMSGGANHDGASRRMAGPAGGRLAYQLYRDSGRSLAWGDDSAQLGARLGGTGSGAAQSLSVYGRIPAGQTPAAGSYTDSVVVTIEY